MSNTPPLDPYQQLPPPATPITQQAYTAYSGHASVGPVIGVLAVITVLGAIAVMIGRLCSGRRILGHAQYDFEGWVEAKCSTCIDGRVDPPPPRAAPAVERTGSNVSSEAAVAVNVPARPPQEMREDETPSTSQQSSLHGSSRRAEP